MADAFFNISSINFSGSAKELEEFAVVTGLTTFCGALETFDALATLERTKSGNLIRKKY